MRLHVTRVECTVCQPKQKGTAHNMICQIVHALLLRAHYGYGYHGYDQS